MLINLPSRSRGDICGRGLPPRGQRLRGHVLLEAIREAPEWQNPRGVRPGPRAAGSKHAYPRIGAGALERPADRRGKQREYVLDDASDVWDKCLKFFHRAIDKLLALDNLLDVDEVCLFFCGHIGWLRHSTAARHNRGRQRFAPAGQQPQENVFKSTDKHCRWPRAQTRSGWQT